MNKIVLSLAALLGSFINAGEFLPPLQIGISKEQSEYIFEIGIEGDKIFYDKNYRLTENATLSLKISYTDPRFAKLTFFLWEQTAKDNLACRNVGHFSDVTKTPQIILSLKPKFYDRLPVIYWFEYQLFDSENNLIFRSPHNQLTITRDTHKDLFWHNGKLFNQEPLLD